MSKRTHLALLPLTALLLGIILSRNGFAAPEEGPGAPDSAIVARVNGAAIFEVEFLRALTQAMNSGIPDTKQTRDSVRGQLIARELFLQEARRGKLESDPAVKRAEQQAREGALVRAYLCRSLRPRAVSDDEVQRHFDQIKSSLGDYEFKPRMIQLADETTAKAILAQLRAGAPFDALARAYSIAPSAAHGGELDWVSFKTPAVEGKTQGVPLPLALAMSNLKVGAVSPEPIKASDYWYVLRVDEARATRVPDFESVKAMLRRTLESQEMERAAEALVKNLLSKARIE